MFFVKDMHTATSCIDDIKDWTGLSFKQLIRTADDREVWKTCVQGTSFCPPYDPQVMGHIL